MSLLILGAKGMLGSMLCQVLADQAPVCWDKEELDITDLAAVREKITALQPTTVINAAAYTAVDEAEEKRDVAFSINAQAVGNLATVAKEIDATMVHYSTDYVFPGTSAEGYTEDDVPGPAVNVYGESKLAGEEVIRQSGARYYLLRTAWLYGPRGKNFVDTMLRLSETKPELRVINDQHGSPTFTKDVALATKELLTRDFSPGIYHAVNAGTATWFELTQEIVKRAGKSVPVVPIPSSEYPLPAKRPKYSMLKSTKGPSLRPWQDALDDYLKNYYTSTTHA